MKQPMKGGERKAGVYVLVSVCVFLGVAEVQRSHLARMQGSSLFFLQRKGKEEGQAKKNNKKKISLIIWIIPISLTY